MPSYLRGRRRTRTTRISLRDKRFRGKSFKKGTGNRLATRAYVRKALDVKNVGVENTTAVGQYSVGTQLVEYRIGKNIGIGTDQGDRVKSQIKLLGIRWDMWLKNNGTANNRGTILRMIIVHDKTPTRPNVENFFVSTNDGRVPVDWGTASDIRKTAWPINKDRFVVLAQKKMVIMPFSFMDASGKPVGSFHRNLRFYMKMNKKLKYNDGYLTDPNDLTPCLKVLYYFEGLGEIDESVAIDYKLTVSEYFSD